MDYIGLECVNGTVHSRNIYTAVTLVKIVALGLIDLVVVFGNSLVIAAVLTTRKLRTVTNIFIVSLACADLLLGFAVMPFSISYEVVKLWLWGDVWCNMWLAIDVWLCTASILSLCAISLDRYIAVTHPIRYPSIISPFRGKMLVSSVWILSFAICLPPLLGWNDTDEQPPETNTQDFLNYTSDTYTATESADIFIDHTISMTSDDYFYEGVSSVFSNLSDSCGLDIPMCELTPTRGYRIYAAMGSFYIPSFVMVFFYLKIYLTAMRTAASMRSGVLLARTSNDLPQHHGGSSDDTIQLRIHRGGSTSSSMYSNKRYSANDAGKHSVYPNKYRSLPLTPCSHQSSTKHIKDFSDYPRRNTALDRKRIDNNAANTKIRSINCLRVFSKRKSKHGELEEGQAMCEGKLHDDLNSNIENHVNNKYPNDKSISKHNRSVNKGDLLTSVKKCKLLIKEPNLTSYTAKGHARRFRRETKAAKTLAIIVGAFIFCWCPFFTIYLIGAFCHNCVSDLVFAVFFWLGYINSALNPCIYALFARDFRAAFRKIVLCKQRRGFNHADRADFVTGTRKTILQQQELELDSTSD